MSGFIAPLLMSAVVFVFYLILLAALLRKYKSTGDQGFLWLCAAIIVWPIVSSLLGWAGHAVMGHLAGGRHASNGATEGGMVSAVFLMLQKIITIGLLLVSVHYLAKGRESAEPDLVTAKTD